MSNLKRRFFRIKPISVLPNILCVSFFLSLSLVSSSATAGGWSNWVKPTIAYAQRDGHIYSVYTEMYNPTNCTNPGYIMVPSSTAAGDRIYSTLLNALATGQKVRYYIIGCSGDYPEMANIMIAAPE